MTLSTEDGIETGERRNSRNRLEAAIDNQQLLEERYDAVRGTGAEFGAAVDLREAKQQVAAREAWSKWIRRDDF